MDSKKQIIIHGSRMQNWQNPVALFWMILALSGQTNAELTITNADSLVYDPDQAVTAGYLLSYNGNVLNALADGYDVSGNTATEVGTYTLTVTAQDKKNYKGTKSVTYEVKPCPLGASTIEGSWSKTYDGTTDLSSVMPTTVKFYIDAEREVSFTNGSDYSVEAVDFDSAAVGTDKTVTIKLKLLNKNYTFADGKLVAEHPLSRCLYLPDMEIRISVPQLRVRQLRSPQEAQTWIRSLQTVQKQL